MKRFMIVLCVVAVVGLMSTAAFASVDVNIYGAGAPNAFGGSSFAPWWANARDAVRSGLTNKGSGVTEYIQLSATGGVSADQPGYQAIVTGFDSWQGVAGGTGEYGTRTHFVYDIKATEGETLALANISGMAVYENGWGDIDYLAMGGPFNFDSTTTFDPNKRVGYKADGTMVTTGNDMTGITEIVGTFGMAYAAYFPNGYWGGATAQECLDNAIADIDANLQSWRGTITYNTTSVETTVSFVPEPATIIVWSLLGLIVAGCGLWRRRRTA
jgi:hypothetical protein